MAEPGLCYGQIDVPLPEDYQLQHHAIAMSLKSEHYDVVYTSPLERCISLAKTISDEVIVDARLKEVAFGDWEGLKWDDIDRKDSDKWMEDYIHLSPPNGESLLDLLKRVEDFIIEISNLRHTKVLIVTHAGIIRCAFHLLGQVPLDKIMMEPVVFSKVYRFDAG